MFRIICNYHQEQVKNINIYLWYFAILPCVWWHKNNFDNKNIVQIQLWLTVIFIHVVKKYYIYCTCLLLLNFRKYESHDTIFHESLNPRLYVLLCQLIFTRTSCFTTSIWTSIQFHNSVLIFMGVLSNFYYQIFIPRLQFLAFNFSVIQDR